MKLNFLLLGLCLWLASCAESRQETKQDAKTKHAIDLVSKEINGKLPLNSIKTAEFKGGIAIIFDEKWCYWVRDDGTIFCVNGAAKSFTKGCETAPFKEGFDDIEKIVR